MSEDQADNLQPTKNRVHSDQLAADQLAAGKLRAHSRTPAEVELSDLIAYLDGELDDSSVEAIEQRLVMDGPLRKKAESLDKTWQLLETLEEAEASGRRHRLRQLSRLQKARRQGRSSYHGALAPLPEEALDRRGDPAAIADRSGH